MSRDIFPVVPGNIPAMRGHCLCRAGTSPTQPGVNYEKEHTVNATIRAGLVLLGLLSVADIAGLALTDGNHPPYVIAVIIAVLGVGSLYFVAKAWTGKRSPLRPLLVLRVVSALTAAPAFFVDDVPVAAKAAAAAILVLTAVGAVLVSRAPVTSEVAR